MQTRAGANTHPIGDSDLEMLDGRGLMGAEGGLAT